MIDTRCSHGIIALLDCTACGRVRDATPFGLAGQDGYSAGYNYSLERPKSPTLAKLWKVLATARDGRGTRVLTFSSSQAKGQGVIEFLMGAPYSLADLAWEDGSPHTDQ